MDSRLQQSLVAIAVISCAIYKPSFASAITVLGLLAVPLVRQYLDEKKVNTDQVQKLQEFRTAISDIQHKVNHLSTKDAAKDLMTKGLGR